uniref:Uncharacterized protein n=1 Tax=Globodera pallida TaxID=36090 RepID=A0A183CCA1_GLOPA
MSTTGLAEAAAAAEKDEAEDRLRKLLSSIGQLSEHGEVPAYAFATLISSAPPQAIAEHLHQRWLSDSHFAKIAPKIISHMSTVQLINNRFTHKQHLQNVKVYSQVLSLVLRDYNLRDEIRIQSRGMFRNYVRTLIELYPVYRQIDKTLSACLVDPLFRCLQMLSEEKPDNNDMLCFANLFAEFGQKLYQLNPSECDRMVLACRYWLCSNRIPLEEETRRLLMNAMDLWTYSWDLKLFPDCLRRYYEETEAEIQRQRQQFGSSVFPWINRDNFPSSGFVMSDDSVSSSQLTNCALNSISQHSNAIINGHLHFGKSDLRGNPKKERGKGTAPVGRGQSGKESTI